jgi:uncharacterized membrane protein YdjX (TVP38/TMEM64 family)
MRARVIFKGLVMIGSLALLGALLKSSGLGDSLTPAWVDAHVRGHGLRGELLFLLIGGVTTAVGLPRQLVSFLGGYAFGVAQGILLGVLAAMLGCLMAFFYARFLGRKLLRTSLGERAGRLDRFIHDHPMTMTILVRLLPVGSNLLTNLAAGISAIRPMPFLLGSFIGYLPQTLVFTLIGSGAHIAPVEKLVVAVSLFVVSSALGVYLYRRFRHGISLDALIDNELELKEKPSRTDAAASRS